MNRDKSESTDAPIKDENAAHPVPCEWRPTLEMVVGQFAKGDYSLTLDPRTEILISEASAKQIRSFIDAYGETLVDLPSATWSTSIAQWMKSHWDLVVDLWTAESGRSDLVLTARVYEDNGGFRFVIQSVHVP